MKLSPEKSAPGSYHWSWIIAGVLLMLLGAALMLTLVLAPVGIGLMAGGLAAMLAGVIRSKDRRGRHIRPFHSGVHR